MNTSNKFLQRIVAAMAVAMMLCLPPLAWSAEPAGFVLMAKGEVNALQDDQKIRKLSRKAPFYSGEILQTGDDSKAQVRFVDGSLISLRANTRIRIDEFSFNDANKRDDKNIFTLINGGFRTITGKIGKKNPKNYQMKSSVASIGVRGTTYEVVMLDGMLNVAAWDGTIDVTNEGGMMTLGAEGVYNFAMVPSAIEPPMGMMSPPPVIIQEQAAVSFNSDKQDSGDMEADAEQPLQTAKDGAEDPMLADVPPPPSPDLIAMNPDGGLLPPPEGYMPPPPVDSVTSGDPRLVGVTLDNKLLGISVRGGSGFSDMLAGGKAGYDVNGDLYIADNDLDPSQSGFATNPYTKVLAQGSAISSSQSYTVAGQVVEWGTWSGSSYLMTDASDPLIKTSITETVYWGLAAATPALSRTGVTNYRNVPGFIGGGNSGAVSNLDMLLNIDFDTGVASGKMFIYTPNELWDVALAGNVSAPVLQFTSVTGDIYKNSTFNSNLAGTVDSLFVGDNGQAIVSAFDLESLADPLIHVEGLALVTQELRLDASEFAALDHIALVAMGGAGVNNFTAMSTDGAAGSPILAVNGLGFEDSGFKEEGFTSVYRKGGAATLVATGENTTYANHVVRWGAWDAGSIKQTDPDDPLVTVAVNQKMHWMTLIPTAPADMPVTGSFYYMNPIHVSGSGTGGAINTASLYFNGSVDFGTGTMLDASMNFDDVAGNSWAAVLDGSVSGSSLIINPKQIDYVPYLGSPQTGGTGSMQAVFTGPAAEMLGGSFDFAQGANAVEGVFLVGQ